jgi:hypothetical protein
MDDYEAELLAEWALADLEAEMLEIEAEPLGSDVDDRGQEP